MSVRNVITELMSRVNTRIVEAGATHSTLRVFLSLASPLTTWILRASSYPNVRRLKMKEQSNVSSMDKFASTNRSGARLEMVCAENSSSLVFHNQMTFLITDPLIIYGWVARILVSHLLVPDPQERATVYAALKSGWICMDLEELDQAYRERIRVQFP